MYNGQADKHTTGRPSQLQDAGEHEHIGPIALVCCVSNVQDGYPRLFTPLEPPEQTIRRESNA